MNTILTAFCIAFVIAVFAYDGWSQARRGPRTAGASAHGALVGALTGAGLVGVSLFLGWLFS